MVLLGSYPVVEERKNSYQRQARNLFEASINKVGWLSITRRPMVIVF